MPKIVIAEKDLTNAEAIQYNDYIVLIPGTLGTPGSESGSYAPTAQVGDEIYFNKVEDFKKAILGSAKASTVDQKMAQYLIGLGMTILYVVISDVQSALEDSNFWEKFQDKSKYNLRFLTSGKFQSVSIAQYMIECAAERGDAIALIDAPKDTSLNPNLVAYLDNFINSLVVAPIIRTVGKEQVLENPFKYAACFSDRVTFKGEETEMPGSFAYLSCFASHTSRFPDWFAMAGSIRGVLPFEKVEVTHVFGSSEIDHLQDRTTENYKAVNPITLIRPYGNIVWGNRTLYPLTADAESETLGLRASNFLNIRNICCDIKKLLYRIGRKYTFEPNSDVLWTNFKSDIKPLLEEMKSGQGIRGYDIVKVETDKKATLTAIVRIIPIEAVEDFDLTVELSDSISVTE